MHKFASCFVRNINGSWLCISPAEVFGDNGLLTTTPGFTYRQNQPIQGYAIAEWLDVWRAKGELPPGVSFL